MSSSEHHRWEPPLVWFGVTLSSSLWLAISAAMLFAGGYVTDGSVFAAGYGLLVLLVWILWLRRERISSYYAWQCWLAAMWIVSLLATGMVHYTGAYPQINIDEWGLLLLYLGVGLGVPLLMLDVRSRHKSGRGVFGAIFDVIASMF